MIKKYCKNCGIIAGMIATANINKATDKTGVITIILDGVKFEGDESCKIDLSSDAEQKEEDIMEFLKYKRFDFKHDSENQSEDLSDKINNALITNIEGEELEYDAANCKCTFAEDKPLTIYLKSKDYIKIKYTDKKQIKYSEEKDLIESIINKITIKDLFESIKYNFKDEDFGVSNINNEGKDSNKKFNEIDGDEVTITLDSSKIDDNMFKTCIFKPAENVKIINKDALKELKDISLDFENNSKNINELNTLFDDSCKVDDKKIITGPFKIKINGTGNEIESTAGKTDLTKAEFIYLIADKNTINPCFLQKEIKLEILGGKDNYVISDETINKIQESLDKLTNLEEVTEKEIFDELKKLEKDIFVENGVTNTNIKCFKGDTKVDSKKDFGTDIRVRIDAKAINPDKIKVKITLGDIKNKDNINLDSNVVDAINNKLKEVKFGITVEEILTILNDNTLKGYFTEALVDADILNNDGNKLPAVIGKNSIIKLNIDKIKPELFIKKTDDNGTKKVGNGNNKEDGNNGENKNGGYCEALYGRKQIS